MSNKHKILIIGSVWLEPNSSAAGVRMLQLISFFQEKQFEVVFASACGPSEFDIDYEKINVLQVEIELNKSSFDGFIKELNPKIVVFDRFIAEEQFGWRVDEYCPNALKILDTEDLQFLRYARQEAWKLEKSLRNVEVYSDKAKREVASILRCDLSLIISDYECQMLINDFNLSPEILFYIPFLAPPIIQETQQNWLSFDKRNHFVFIGNFLHEPNINAVHELKTMIWPSIKKQIPSAELHIYGAYVNQKIAQLSNVKEGFIVKGRAENVQTLLEKYRVTLAPIRFGAGLKGKLFESMLCGTPSVTTQIGAEGMRYTPVGELDWNGVVSDENGQFILAACNLYQNENDWKEAQSNGVKIISKVFNKFEHEINFNERINNTLLKLKNHRQNNFLGQVLQFHSLRSTKYMSKWIEEKDKR